MWKLCGDDRILMISVLLMLLLMLNTSRVPAFSPVLRRSVTRALSHGVDTSARAVTKKRVLSGVQPTGMLHLGNYLGAIRQWVSYQDLYDNYFCVVDLHAVTVPHDPKRLAADTRQSAAMYLACGIDPQKSKIFVQSHVSAHSEMTWLLNCITPMSWLERMIQYKEKSVKQGENVGVGLFDYPVLMAADILLYRAELVPVGEDQRQHLELAREVARRFNHEFCRKRSSGNNGSSTSDSGNSGSGSGNGNTTPLNLHCTGNSGDVQTVSTASGLAEGSTSSGSGSKGGRRSKQQVLLEPKALVEKDAARVMSLQDGLSKMSKSAESDYSRINLLDHPGLVALKIRRCKTDSYTGAAGIEWDNPARPEATNLLNIYKAVTGRTPEEVRADVAGLQWGGFKALLTDAVVAHLSPIQARYREISADPAYVDGVLREGRLAASAEAERTLAAAKAAMGFLPPTP